MKKKTYVLKSINSCTKNPSHEHKLVGYGFPSKSGLRAERNDFTILMNRALS